MASVKRTNTDYEIEAIDSNVNVTARNFTINGNLLVVGTSSTVESVNTFIYDNFITLAAGQTGAPTVDAGIEVERGNSPTVGIRWHESGQEWQYTNDGTIWQGFKFKLVDDPDPTLGANLNTNGYTITSNIGLGEVKIGPVIRLPQISSDPGALSGFSTIYAKLASSGDTALYIANEKREADELVTRRKALLYSIIF